MEQESLDPLIAEAVEHERRYEWDEAAKCYRNLIQPEKHDAEHFARTSFKLGRALELAAAQAEGADQFQTKIKSAIAVYQEVETRLAENPVRAMSRVGQAHRLRLESMFPEGLTEKRKLLNDAIRIHAGAVEELRSEGGKPWLEAGVFQLLLLDQLVYLGGGDDRVHAIREGLSLSERLIPHLREQEDGNLLGEAHFYRDDFASWGANILEGLRDQKARYEAYLDETLAIVPRIQDQVELGLLHSTHAWIKELVLGSDKRSIDEEITKSLDAANVARDRQVLGVAIHHLEYSKRWELVFEQDEEQARRRLQEVGELFGDGVRNLRHILFPLSQFFLPMLYAELVQSKYIYANNFVPDQGRRKQLIEESVSVFREGIPLARKVENHPEAYLSYAGAEAIRYLAALEENREKRRELLTEAIGLSERNTELLLEYEPQFKWNVGVAYILEGTLRYEVAKGIDDPGKRGKILTVAVERFRSGLSKASESLRDTGAASPGLNIRFADFHFRLTKLLSDLLEVTGDTNLIQEQLQALDQSAEAYMKAKRSERVAEASWQKARIYSKAERHSQSAEEYKRAADAYRSAYADSPKLKNLYADLEKYMYAWSNIEQAKLSHGSEKYAEAAVHYSDAAQLLGRTENWSYLNGNLLALASLEKAEDLSRKGKSDDALYNFESAADLFAEAQSTISLALGGIPTNEERMQAEEIVEAIPLRREYCRARIELEQARSADKRGDELTAGEKYSLASEAFAKLSRSFKSEVDKKEIEQIAYLAKAWQKMMEAERKSEPDLYAEAAQAFRKVREIATREKLSLLATGNSYFCQALQMALEFKLTRNQDVYSRAKSHMDYAAEFYSKADFEDEASWAKATQRVFDAYVYVSAAQTESELDRKAKYYLMSEKVLGSALELYERAGFRAKVDEVLSALQNVREEKELALSLNEVLVAPEITRSTSSFTLPAPTHESSVGLERFEQAEVQSTLTVSKNEVNVGENLIVEIEAVNVGRVPAFMTKIEELLPEGFEVLSKPEHHRLVGGVVELKVRRLEPLRPEEMKFELRARKKGTFSLKPRIHFVDDYGKHRSHSPEPVVITVKELGIFGWISGRTK